MDLTFGKEELAFQQEVRDWLKEKGLPAVESGSYYVKAFRPEGELPDLLRPLARDGLLRLCFKPPQV